MSVFFTCRLGYSIETDEIFYFSKYGGPSAVVKADCLERRRSQARTPLWHSLKKQNVSSPLMHKDPILWGASVTERSSDSQGLNFEFCVRKAVSSHSSHHPEEVLLAPFSLYVHKGGLKPHSFHFLSPSYLTVM